MYEFLLWSWIKVRYESESKLDPLKSFYGENIRSLKLKAGGLLVNYIDRFQGLAILWQEIDKSVGPEDRLVTQMVKQIEDPLFYGPCESIKNWDTIRRTFRDAADTLWAHEISKMTSQEKIAIGDEINRVLIGKGYNKSRATVKTKILRELKLGGTEYEKQAE